MGRKSDITKEIIADV